MCFRRDEFTRTALAPAKLNLYLEVLGRQGDGYHELESLMLPVRLYDVLAFTLISPPPDDRPANISLDVQASFASSAGSAPHSLPPSGGQNLVVQTLRLLQDRSGCRAGAHVRLVKRIPMESGLGGGSSDAAAALELANRAWRLDWHRDRLVELAAELGADVPFFLYRSPAICRGRGERVEPVSGLAPLNFVIVKPPTGLKTSDVYRTHDQRELSSVAGGRGRLQALVQAIRRGSCREVGAAMLNRLESSAALLSPWVDAARDLFERFGCFAHQLSGSGTAYFGVCRHRQQARRLAARLRTRQLGLVYVTRSHP